MDHTVSNIIGGREGLFVLLTNKDLSASETLGTYRSRKAVEAAFRDLKQDIN